MKRHMITLLVFVLAGIIPAYAQNALRVDIPFDFTIANKPLAAGQYTLQIIHDLLTVQILSESGRVETYALVIPAVRSSVPEVITQWTPGTISGYGSSTNQSNPVQPQATKMDNCVVFNQYGGQYFIAKMWFGLEGREFPITRSERAVRTAGTDPKPATLLLAASLP
jgi:hypothetical protein